jgi:hypothetical protein
MIVGLATDVFVVGWDNSSRFFGFDLVELGIEDILDPLVGVNASRKGALSCTDSTGRRQAASRRSSPYRLASHRMPIQER